jgi:hypothetical protein
MLKLNESMNLDLHAVEMQPGMKPYGKNWVYNTVTGSIENEDGFLNVPLDLGDKERILGVITVPTGYILFTKDEKGTEDIDHIRWYQEDLLHVHIQSKELKLTDKRQINGEFTFNYKGELIICWSEGIDDDSNETRYLNLDTAPQKPAWLEDVPGLIESMALQPDIKLPLVEYDILDTGSSLTGTYQIAIAYQIEKGQYTDVFKVTPSIYITAAAGLGMKPKSNIAKSIVLRLSNLDIKFKYYRLHILYKGESALDIRYTSDIPITTTTYTIDNISNLLPSTVEETENRHVIYTHCEGLTNFQGQLVQGNVRTLDYNKNGSIDDLGKALANEVNVELKRELFDVSYPFIRDVNQNVGFQSNEVYALYLNLIDRKGNYINSYLIPTTTRWTSFTKTSVLNNDRRLHYIPPVKSSATVDIYRPLNLVQKLVGYNHYTKVDKYIDVASLEVEGSDYDKFNTTRNLRLYSSSINSFLPDDLSDSIYTDGNADYIKDADGNLLCKLLRIDARVIYPLPDETTLGSMRSPFSTAAFNINDLSVAISNEVGIVISSISFIFTTYVDGANYFLGSFPSGIVDSTTNILLNENNSIVVNANDLTEIDDIGAILNGKFRKNTGRYVLLSIVEYESPTIISDNVIVSSGQLEANTTSKEPGAVYINKLECSVTQTFLDLLKDDNNVSQISFSIAERNGINHRVISQVMVQRNTGDGDDANRAYGLCFEDNKTLRAHSLDLLYLKPTLSEVSIQLRYNSLRNYVNARKSSYLDSKKATYNHRYKGGLLVVGGHVYNGFTPFVDIAPKFILSGCPYEIHVYRGEGAHNTYRGESSEHSWIRGQVIRWFDGASGEDRTKQQSVFWEAGFFNGDPGFTMDTRYKGTQVFWNKSEAIDIVNETPKPIARAEIVHLGNGEQKNTAGETYYRLTWNDGDGTDDAHPEFYAIPEQHTETNRMFPSNFNHGIADLLNNQGSYYPDPLAETLVLSSGIYQIDKLTPNNKIPLKGDTFWGDFTIRTTYPSIEFDIVDYGELAAKAGYVHRFVFSATLESRLNLNARYGGGTDDTRIFSMKADNPMSVKALIMDVPVEQDNYINTDTGVGYDTCFNWNGSKTDIIIDKVEGLAHIINRIIRSDKTNTESLALGWQKFRVDNYYDVPLERGAIVNLQSDTSNLYIQQQYALRIASVKDTLSGDSDAAYVGSGDLFDRYPKEVVFDKNGYIGCRDKFMCYITPLGYVVLDSTKGKLFLVNGENANEITSENIRRWSEREFANKLGEPLTVTDGWDDFAGYTGCYDAKYNRFLFGRYNSDRELEHFTLDYHPQYKIGCFHDYHPNYMFFNRDGFYLISDGCTTLWKGNNTDVKCKFFTKEIFPTVISFAHTERKDIDKLYSNIIWQTIIKIGDRYFYNETINRILIHNDTQCTDIINVNENKEWFEVESGVGKASKWFFNRIDDAVLDDKKPFITRWIEVIKNNCDINKKDFYDVANFIGSHAVITLFYDNLFYNNISDTFVSDDQDKGLQQAAFALITIDADVTMSNR